MAVLMNMDLSDGFDPETHCENNTSPLLLWYFLYAFSLLLIITIKDFCGTQ